MEVSYSDKNVLIVDNRLEDLGEFKKILGRIGVGVIQVASSVNMALALLREEQYDICFIVFDLGKGQKNGLQLIQEAAAEGSRKHSCAFILIVDPDRSKILFGSLDSAPDAYISKPYDEAKVRSRLEKILRIKHVLQPLEEMLDAGDMHKALELCCQFGQEYPGLNLYILRIRGIILIELGLYAEAVRLFASLITHRDLPWAKVGLGLAHCHLGEYRQAQRYLMQVIDDSHLCVEAYFWLARAHRALGEWSTAISLLRKAILLQPTIPQFQAVLGGLAAQTNDWALATDAYRAAIKFSAQGCLQSDVFYFGLVVALQSRINSSGSAESLEAEIEAVRLLEDVVDVFSGQPVVQFKSRLMAASVYQAAGSMQRSNLVIQSALDLFSVLELTEQAKWIDPLMDVVAGSDVEMEAQALKQQINQHIAKLDWGRLNIQGLLHYRKKEYHKALDFFVRADGILPNNPSVVLNLVQSALEQADELERKDILLQCDNALYSVNYGALGSRQKNRYITLTERCAEMIKELLDGGDSFSSDQALVD